jgi:modulator of FtsH protease
MDNDLDRNLQRANPYANYGRDAGVGSLIARNAVLRNTYWLLALSLIPTVIGAWAGIAFNFAGVMGARPGMTAIIFLVGAFGLMFAIERNKDSGIGVALLLAFTFFMGLMLSQLLARTLLFTNGVQLISLAFGGTAVIFGAMATIATVSKRDFSGMGRFLMMGVIVILIAALANIFLQLPALMLAVSLVAIVIFSAFMLYDVQRVVNGGETNYIRATLAIYLDIYNVFVNLLAIFGIFGGSRD